MVLKELGQTFRSGQKKFKVGDFAAVCGDSDLEMCGVILEVDIDSRSALIDFGEDGAVNVPLESADPLPMEVPAETGKQYVLYYVCAGAEGYRAGVLGISENRNLLIYRMLEAVNGHPGVRMSLASMDNEQDSLQFIYDRKGTGNQLHLDYAIVPAAVYSKVKEGDAV